MEKYYCGKYKKRRGEKMKCNNCKKEMDKYEQLLCHYAFCKNKKCKFEGLVKVYNFEDSLKQSEKIGRMQ